MQKNAHIVTACPIGRTGHAASAMIAENAYPRTIFRERLNTFIAQRERLVGSVDSAADVITFVEKRVTDIVGEISSASEEQSAGIEQVNQAVSQMDQVTQQNAALVEEALAAAQSMAQQAQDLRETVAFFKVDATGSTASRMIDREGKTRLPVLAPKIRTLRHATSSRPETRLVVGADRSNAVATDAGDAVDWQVF
jgi:hypothetical protein